MRKLTEYVSEGFIWSIGITRPKPGHERTAALFITATLIACVLVAGGIFLFLLNHL